MNSPVMVFEGDCRHCPHTIERELEATAELYNSKEDTRIRCKECRGITPLEQTEVV